MVRTGDFFFFFFFWNAQDFIIVVLEGKQLVLQ